MNQLQVCSVAQIQALVSKAFGRKKVLLIVAVITAVSFAAASVWLCLSSTGATALKVQNISKPVVTVELINPTVVRLRSDITVTGAIAARDSLEVGSEASGLRIEQVYVEEGDTVRRGQMLARLNTSVLEATLHEETALLLWIRNSDKASPLRPLPLQQYRPFWCYGEAGTKLSASPIRVSVAASTIGAIIQYYFKVLRESGITKTDPVRLRTRWMNWGRK